MGVALSKSMANGSGSLEQLTNGSGSLEEFDQWETFQQRFNYSEMPKETTVESSIYVFFSITNKEKKWTFLNDILK